MTSTMPANQNTRPISGPVTVLLTIACVALAVLGVAVTAWNLLVAGPAIRDYDELHQVVRDVLGLVFGS